MATPLWNIFTIIGTEAMSFKTLMNTLANSVESGITASQKTGVPTVASSAARDALFPAPVQGNRVWRSDLQYSEVYYSVYNATTNPAGMAVATWYPDAPITAKITYPDHNISTGTGYSLFTSPTFDTNISSTNYGNSFAIMTGTAAGRLQIRNPGMYMFGATSAFPAGTGPRNFSEITLKNPTGGVIETFRGSMPSNEDTMSFSSAALIPVKIPGSYLELQLYQNSGGTRLGNGKIYATRVSSLV